MVMKSISFLCFLNFAFVIFASAQSTTLNDNDIKVKTASGIIEGYLEKSDVISFKGIPYAAPPIGRLRWKEPQPVKSWTGTRMAIEFGNKPMQLPLYSDMQFRSKSMGEDCLYLNVWTPTNSKGQHLPVLVYFHGGGLAAGDGSELRYDGAYMAGKGIITITINYRLGIFGFFAHPELTKESMHKSSGNYGLLDQRAALLWVKNNIAFFGGDPKRVTIAGQSAGSRSVCAQMASPISKNLFSAAIGESGSMLAITPPPTLAEVEKNGLQFMQAAGVNTLIDLRKMDGEKLLELVAKNKEINFGAIVDGYFLPSAPKEIYATGLQADIPLLAGWNSAEMSYKSILGNELPTLENYKEALQKLYDINAVAFLKQYPAATDEEVIKAATALASDRSIAYNTWKWIDLHSKTNGKPVYRYLFTHALPSDDSINNVAQNGAPHSAEIEYAMGNLSLSKAHPWKEDDYKVSKIMSGFFINFIKTGNPNGAGLPTWYGLQSSIPKVMLIDVDAHSEPEKNAKRYLFLDQFYYP